MAKKRLYDYTHRATPDGPIPVVQLNRRICKLTADVFTETCRRRNISDVVGLEWALAAFCGVAIHNGKPAKSGKEVKASDLV